MHDTRSVPELPQLQEGVHLLETPERAIGPLHALVLDHLLLDGGSAVWVDANGYGTSMHLAEVAPSRRILDRIRIARGFTAYQHQALVANAVEPIDDETSLVVAPAVDASYRADDIRGAEPKTMLLQSLARLAQYARERGVPVLTTRTTADRFSAPIAQLADETITVEQTAFGPRFESDGFETLVYAERGGTRQTTLTYWKRILAARAPVHTEKAAQTPTSEVRP